MTARARFPVLLSIAALVLVTHISMAAQPSADDAKAIAHARHLFQLLREDKHKEVAAEFNEKMAAAMPVEKMSAAWASVLQQTGAFKSIVDEQVQHPQDGFTAVVLGCEFENASVNAMFVFDGTNKLAGLAFRPRQ